MKFILTFLLFSSNIYADAVIYKIKGNIEFINDKKEKILLKEGDSIGKNYEVMTQKNSEVELLIEDIGMVVVYENSKFVISDSNPVTSLSFLDKLLGVKNLYAEEEKSFVDYLYGKATFFIKKLGTKKYSVRTPTAVCGVRGTSFSVISDDKASEIGLFKGVIEVGKGEEVKTLNPGQTAYVSRTEIKINERLSKIMEKEKKRAEKLEKYFDNVRKKIDERNKKISEKLSKKT
ncbi:MAG: FecR family protein [Elusimicrobiales bacterium]